MNPHYDGDIESPNGMMVDPAEYVDQLEEMDEKDDVAIINPDQLDGDSPDNLRADNPAAMKELIFQPTLENPPILAEAEYTWHIENWRNLPRKEHGPTFEAGGFPWRVLMFPTGNNVESASFYLEQGFEDEKPPENWSCCVHFALVLWNRNDPTIYVHNSAHHRFTKEEGDWGFTRFVDLRKLWAPWDAETRRPLIENEAAEMTAYVRVVKDETGVLWHNFQDYDSKKETGFVGLKNQGATCYLNSLIQSLYFTNAFRKAIYQIPTQEEETLGNSAYTLQRLFYQLQTSNAAVSTNELTKSFGWETRHIFEQQDVQELSRKLMERMEEKMKGTEAENVLSKLFTGNSQTYISCINVAYDSRRSEPFWDVQLNVSGNEDIESSFRDYIQVEIMNGDNQYYAGDEHKLQDAKKGVIFQSFPDVLNLQLKRFQYDVEHDAMMKINDRYEFPETFDAAPYLADDIDRSESWVYQLHSVLVHSGDLNAGHYYAFIKPAKDGWFYKYDDDRVTKATMREVLEENYGGEYLQPNGERWTNKNKPLMRQNSAYMLVYIRQTRAEQVLLPVTQDDTPPHLQKRLDEEAAEREARRKEREESHLYLSVRVITDDTFKNYGGTDLTVFDAKHDVDKSAARSYRVLKKMTIGELVARVAEDTDVDPRQLRLWCMVNRQNKTVRPDTPVMETYVTLEEVHSKMSGNKQQELRLWAELSGDNTPDGVAIWPTFQNIQNGTAGLPKTDLIALFLKHFDVEAQTLRGAGHIYISREKKVEELVPAILKKMEWLDKLPNGERLQLKLFEEIKPNMIEPMKAKQSLKAAELQDGDIICFQKATEGKDPKSTDQDSLSSKTADRHQDAKDFYDFLLHKRIVRFHPHPRNLGNADIQAAYPKADEAFNLELSSKNTYDQLAIKVGDRLGVNPTHLRLWTANLTNGAVKNSVKRNLNQNLHAILNPPYSSFSSNTPRQDVLYFEVLEMSLSELDTKKGVKVTWLSEGTSKEDPYDLLVPKNGNANDIINELIKKARLDDEVKGGLIRLYEVHNGKIYKELSRDHAVLSINDYVQLYAERIPEEELSTPQDELDLLQVIHFQNEPAKAHGIPFKFRIIKDEKFSDTKKRLEKRTGLKGKNFEKIKFAVIKRSAYSKPIYLTDDDILYSAASSDDDLLGLDHLDRSRANRGGAGDLFLR